MFLILFQLYIVSIFLQPALLFPSGIQSTPFSGSVNVITGEYTGMSTDLVISGPKPLTLQRSFCGFDNGDPGEGLAWHFNHPGILSPEINPMPMPSAEDFLYEYLNDANGRLAEIKLKNYAGDKVYSALQFDYRSTGSDNLCEVKASDGRCLSYHYQEGEVARGTKNLVISHWADAEGNQIRYDYRQHPTERKKLIKRIEDSMGGYLDTEYYDGKHNNVGGTLVTLSDSLRDFRIGRIKQQKAPLGPDGSPIISQCFFYHKGSTDVIRSDGQKNTYYYNDDQLLTAIETYSEGALHKVEKFSWNAAKKLVSKTLEDGNGQTIFCRTYDYDARGLLIAEKCLGNITGRSLNSPECAEWSYQYEQYGPQKELSRLVQKKEPDGKITRYLYDAESLRIHAILSGDLEGIHLRQFHLYNADGLLIETITDDGSSNAVDDLSGVTERQLARFYLREAQPAMGMPERIEELCYSKETGEEIPIRSTFYTYNQLNKAVQKDIYDETGNYAYSLHQKFDTQGRKVSQTEAGGKEIFWEYDANGNIVHELIKEKNRTLLSTQKIYDQANRLIKEISCKEGGKEEVTSHRYNAISQKIAEIDHFGNETEYQYDQMGRLSSITYPAVLTASDLSERPRKFFSYDLFDRCTQAIDSNGDATTTSYNIWGKPLVILYPDQTKEEFEYYVDGSLKKKTDRIGISTHFFRDYQSRVVREEKYASSGEFISSTDSIYNALHLLKQIDSNKIETSYAYDSQGRQKSCSKFKGEDLQLVEYEYDPLGHVRVKKEWFGDGPDDFFKCITERDAANHIFQTHIEDANGSIVRQQVQKEGLMQKQFDKWNPSLSSTRQSENIDSAGNTTTISYDALGRAEAIVKKNSFGVCLSEVTMRYDLAGNKTKEIHRRSGGEAESSYILSWKYGPGGRLEELIEGTGSREQRTTRYLYNEKGQLKTIVKPDGVTLEHNYNELGKIARFFSSDGTIDYEYIYEGNGNSGQVIDRVNGTLSQKQYNDSGLLVDETLANGLSMNYTYDKIGRCTSYTLPDDSSVHYQYDAANLLQIVRRDKAQQDQYCHTFSAYDASGNILAEMLPQSCGSIDYQYDQEGHRTATTSSWWNESLKWETAHGSKETHPVEWIGNDPLGKSYSKFTFDNQSRLIEESGHAANSYTYDTLGNRISCNSEPQELDALNSLIYDGSNHYAYDANGNLTQKIGKQEQFSFGYDALNRLTSVVIDEAVKILYIYDPQGRRTEKILQEYSAEKGWNSTQTVKYIYFHNDEIGEVHAAQEIVSHRILGQPKSSSIGSTIAIELGDTLYATINDYRGNIACLVDTSNGKVAEFYRYEAFGKQAIFGEDLSLKTSQTALSPWRYSSKRYDAETDLVYFGKRYYSPQIGRWITADPLGYVDGINRYAYVHNNPLANSDHYGLFSCSSTCNTLMECMGDAFESIMNNWDKITNFIGINTSYLQQIHPDMTTTLETYFGKGFLRLAGYYTFPLENGIYGQGEVAGNVRITLINGILTLRSDYRDSLELINSTHGGVNIHYIYRPTSGWCKDLVMALLIKCGYVSPYAKELVSTWRAMIADMGGLDGGGTILHYCHSLGGTDTVLAASLLSPEERQMIHVISFGSATMISNHTGFGAVTNFVSMKDGVSLLDPVGYIKGLTESSTNILFISSPSGIPFGDHLLSMPTYSETLTRLGQLFMQQYAYSGGLI